MKLLLERAGVDVDDEELALVLKACPVCRAWQKPSIPPKVKSTLAARFNDEVEISYNYRTNLRNSIYDANFGKKPLQIISVSILPIALLVL